MVQPKALAPLQFPHSIPQASPIVPQNASFEARDKVAATPDSRIARHAARRNVGVHQKESIFDLIVYLAVPSLLCRLDGRGLWPMIYNDAGLVADIVPCGHKEVGQILLLLAILHLGSEIGRAHVGTQ